MRLGTRHIFFIAFFCVWIFSIVGCESVTVRTMRGARYYAWGSEALELGDSGRAILDLERAAVLVPQASEIQNHLGLAYWAAGQPDKAHFAFDRAVELDCDNQAARQNRERLEATVIVAEKVFEANEAGLDDEGDSHGG